MHGTPEDSGLRDGRYFFGYRLPVRNSGRSAVAASTDSHGSVLQINIGKKYDQPLDEAYRVDFAYRVAAETAGYLKVTLTAAEGLHELGPSEYLDIKRKEYLRQQAEARATSKPAPGT